MAAYHGIVLHRHRERIPRVKVGGKWHAAYTGKKTEAGIPDLFGYLIPRPKPRQTKASNENFSPGGSGGSVAPLSAQIPNSVGIFPYAIFIEAKRPVGGRRRPAQIAFIENACLDGAIAMFATSWDDVVRGLLIRGIEL